MLPRLVVHVVKSRPQHVKVAEVALPYHLLALTAKHLPNQRHLPRNQAPLINHCLVGQPEALKVLLCRLVQIETQWCDLRMLSIKAIRSDKVNRVNVAVCQLIHDQKKLVEVFVTLVGRLLFPFEVAGNLTFYSVEECVV